MERQSKEESQMLWRLELESAKMLDLTPEHSELIKVVTKKIEDYTLTYEEYLSDIAEYLQSASDDEQPKEVIKNMCNHLIQKYGSEEVRSEQDQDGSSTIECDGIISTDSDNGGTEVLGEQLAESTGLLEEIQSSAVEASYCNR